MNVCQRKSTMGHYKWEHAPMVVRRSDTKTPSKSPLKTSTNQQSRSNRLHRIEQSGETSQEGVLVNTKQKNQRSQAETYSAESQISTTEFCFSELSCFICNRQFRAKIGLISHLRTLTYFSHLIRLGHCRL